MIIRAVLAFFWVCLAAWSQGGPAPKQLTARELFYAAAAPAPATKPAATSAAAAKPAGVKTSEAKSAAKRTPPPAVSNAPAERVESAPIVRAAYAPRQGLPLGLRYTILKRVESQMVEVAPDAPFRAGDRIQVSVETNDAGYLYIVHQGSSGAWRVLFPSSEVEQGNNRVEKGRGYAMPPGSRFYFDEQAGVEKLFVVLSRRPEPDLEKLIYSLRAPSQPAPAAAPSSPAPGAGRSSMLLASNLQVEDSLVGRLRNVYARDLVIEKVDDEAPAPAAGRKEKAVYVVNASGSPDSRVVADIRLTHQ